MPASDTLSLPPLPPREPDSHKGSFGSVLVAAGSRRYPGAAVLTALGAGRAGAGLVRLALPAGIVETVVPAAPFATVRPCPETDDGGLARAACDEILDEAGTCRAAVIGPGLGQAPGTAELLAELLPRLPIPLALDADGLNLLGAAGLATLAGRPAVTVLTPHPGEFARLTGQPAPQGAGPRRQAAEALARQAGVVVVLKGHGTVTTDGRRTRVETAGNPGMATGGMGDVLSGVLGALLAVVPDAAEAAALSVRLHALAGDLAAEELGQEAVLPEDVARLLGQALARHRVGG
jgi:NAD(P)H-hydrate epimerase